jgi:hypothetical protein
MTVEKLQLQMMSVKEPVIEFALDKHIRGEKGMFLRMG